MSQDSATTTSPPPHSTTVDSMSKPSTQEDKFKKLDEEEPKQLTLEPELTELIQPPELNHVTLEPEQTQPPNSEPKPSLPLISEPEVPNHTAEGSEQPHRVTPETMASEPEEPNHTEEDHSDKPHQVTPETEPTQELMLEHRKKYTEVADWTEPEPPEAAVLEAAASVPEPKQPEPQSPEVAVAPPPPPAAAASSSVESRSLAEMMNREEAEEKPKIQIPRSLGSFKEETNKISDLSETELNALHELRHLLQESTTIDSCKSSIWGVPLLKDDRSDVVLLKFLRARDFKPQEAYSMLNKTLQWRIEFNIEELLDENLGDDLDKVVFMQGHDKENHPVCYNAYGEFQSKDLYQKTFSDEEKRERFLRWRIQFLEKSIRKLDFVAVGVSTICQVNDLKNSPGPGKTELRLATKQALHLLQDNYPEFVSKQIFINVPWWYLAFYRIISPFMTQRSKSKLVFAGPSRSAETLFKYISPEHVPVQYGGLSVDNCDCISDFTHDDTATEITIKPTTKQTVEIIVYEKCTIVWEIRVVGWEVLYGAEFVPENKGGYTVIIQKPRKMAAKVEPLVSQSFKVGEVGKILLTVDNPSTAKKMLIYRFKVKPLACE
ncbi:hypothetical protein EUTSA_v10028522mg [Eutrema salsugineum]|uniref:CRAL-TRIO domain-containing protein n=1 Tax=Eutrema salsugineum TaxID=72664 RepID=V4N0V4_EUTSA|nr:patellin-5 [Eutrema salsugineum]ESQ38651.1 hypothetical protein EUTSA_v10028522mg [Eutrema salsugineum]